MRSGRRGRLQRALHGVTVGGTALAGVSALVAAANSVFVPRLNRGGAAGVHESAGVHERVAVCVPARNEEATLPVLVTDLRAQTYPGPLKLLILDDDSDDRTATVASEAAAGDPRITVLSSTAAPPPGWTGKAAACHRLAEIADGDSEKPDIIVFIDADVTLAPDAIEAAVVALRRHDAALLCPWPEQLTGTVAERLVQPLLSFSWMSTAPIPLANRSTRPSMAVACGQFLAFDANSYRAVGGHEAVASSPTDDLDIARVLRRHGRRTVLVSGAGFVACRMYRGWPELRAGYTRWLWSSFGSRTGSAAVLTAAVLAYLVPPAAAVLGSGRTRRVGAVGYLAAVAARWCSARSEATGRPDVAAVLAHPVSALLFAGLVLDSHRRHRRSTLSWKNRPLT